MSTYRIMLVDDDKENLELLQKELTAAGNKQIEVYYNSTEALERFESEKFHIVLINPSLTSTDGINLLSVMKSLDSLVQFIAISKHSTINTVLECLELGVNDFFVNPINKMNEVLDTVQLSIRKLERLKLAMRECLLN